MQSPADNNFVAHVRRHTTIQLQLRTGLAMVRSQLPRMAPLTLQRHWGVYPTERHFFLQGMHSAGRHERKLLHISDGQNGITTIRTLLLAQSFQQTSN